MFDASFIDLDSTIYETNRLVEAMRKIFLDAGVSDDDFEESKDKAICPKDNYFDYTFENQFFNLREKGYALPDDVIQKLHDLLKVNYVASGAKDLLEFLKDNSNKMILLSGGNSDFQRKKLISSGLENFFNEIHFVHGNKEEIVRQKIGAGKSLFVNDSLRENFIISKSFPNVVVLSRVNPMKPRTDYLNSGLPFFENLIDIQKYVEQQIQ